MEKIDKKLMEILEHYAEKVSTSREEIEKIESFEKASVEFERLVEVGILKKRGYSVMTVSEALTQQIMFNV